MNHWLTACVCVCHADAGGAWWRCFLCVHQLHQKKAQSHSEKHTKNTIVHWNMEENLTLELPPVTLNLERIIIIFNTTSCDLYNRWRWRTGRTEAMRWPTAPSKWADDEWNLQHHTGPDCRTRGQNLLIYTQNIFEWNIIPTHTKSVCLKPGILLSYAFRATVFLFLNVSSNWSNTFGFKCERCFQRGFLFSVCWVVQGQSFPAGGARSSSQIHNLL